MWTRSIIPLLTLVLLFPIAAAHAEDVPSKVAKADAPKSASQQFCGLYLQWSRIHRTAARRSQPVRADLTFDPKSGTIAIERGTGASSTAEKIKLPSGMTWHAFHISIDGVRRLSFPVVLQRPHHHAKRSPRDDEEIWIFGNSKNAEVHFHVISRTTGASAGGGSGSGVKSSTLKVGMLPIRDAGFRRKVSILPADTLNGRPAEFIESKGVRFVEVLRETAH